MRTGVLTNVNIIVATTLIELLFAISRWSVHQKNVPVIPVIFTRDFNFFKFGNRRSKNSKAFDERFVVAAVQEKHFVADTHGLHTQIRQRGNLRNHELRTPEPHAARMRCVDAVVVAVSIYDVDHAKIASEIAAKRRIDRGKGRAFFVVELRSTWKRCGCST